jgi:hypothetical protein
MQAGSGIRLEPSRGVHEKGRKKETPSVPPLRLAAHAPKSTRGPQHNHHDPTSSGPENSPYPPRSYCSTLLTHAGLERQRHEKPGTVMHGMTHNVRDSGHE